MYAMLSLVWITLKEHDVKHMHIHTYWLTHTQILPDTLLLNLLGGGAVERERQKGEINIIVFT